MTSSASLITLPPLPSGYWPEVVAAMRNYARAAVEADRQAHFRDAAKMVPSDASLEKAWDRFEAEMARQPTDFDLEEFMAQFADEAGCIHDDQHAQAARALLSRYSSGQSAAVRCNHCGWHGADADLVRDVAADEPEDGAADVCPQCKRIGDLQDIGQPAPNAAAVPSDDDLLGCAGVTRQHDGGMPTIIGTADIRRFADCVRKHWGSSQPAASAEPVVMKEICPECGHQFECFHNPYINQLRASPVAAPVAQEPVAEVLSSRKGNDTSTIDKALPDGTKLYAWPVAAQAAPIQWPTMPPRKGQSPVLFDDGYAEGWAKCMSECQKAVAAQAQHPDDAAVDRFAAAMKTKLAQKRAEGRGGWEDKAQCSQDRLSLMLRGHVAKGDPVDVGNFCMMLHQRGERISGHDAASPSAQDREDDEALADTQRAIIEAAERRGYARAEAENVGYRTDAGRYREFFEAGLPITFLGIDYHDKPSLDAAIDAARAAKGE